MWLLPNHWIIFNVKIDLVQWDIFLAGAKGRGRGTQRQLLDFGPAIRRHVREWELQKKEAHEETLQGNSALSEGLLRRCFDTTWLDATQEHI